MKPAGVVQHTEAYYHARAMLLGLTYYRNHHLFGYGARQTNNDTPLGRDYYDPDTLEKLGKEGTTMYHRYRNEGYIYSAED